MRLYIGPFEWRERRKAGQIVMPGQLGWRMPDGATQAVEFGPSKGAGTPGQFAGRAIFVCDDSANLPLPFRLAATDPLEVLNQARIDALRSAFGVTTSSAVRFLPLIHELFTSHADVSRTVKAPPRVAGRRRTIKWILGGFVQEVAVGRGAPEWEGIKARHRLAYRRIRALGDLILHRKYLGAVMRRYGLRDFEAVDDFIPEDLPREQPLEPTTTITESFTGTSDTFGGDQTWTEVTGDWDNASGRGTCVTVVSTVYARCEGTLSTDDMRVQFEAISDSSQSPYFGPAARFAAAATTMYAMTANRGINDYYGHRISAGASTDIITSELTGSITLPSTDAIEIDGDVLEIFQGANSRGSTTDTNITGNVRGGMALYQEGTAATFDNWQAEDLAAAGGIVGPLIGGRLLRGGALLNGRLVR